MRLFRDALVALLASLCFVANPTSAASFSTDQSDLYYIAKESGWGMQLVQRGDTIFATLFVYGQSTAPTWFVATLLPSGQFMWSGDLYATTGPWFATVPFDTALVTGTKVGTMTWDGSLVNSGTVTYTVNGIQVVKDVIRQSLVNENYSGHFAGGVHQVNTGCSVPANNGTREQAGIVDIFQSGTAMTINTSSSGGSGCAYTGSLTQYGQMGQLVGTFACSDGSVGGFAAIEMQVTEFSVSGRFNASYVLPAGCQATGWFGGVAVTTF